MAQGLGDGTAYNKARTYLLISSPEPGEGATSQGGNSKKELTSQTTAQKTVDKGQKSKKSAAKGKSANPAHEMIPLNVNVQIHISADASGDQIESIFKSMRQYLYSDQDV
ncbi:MAG: hypothetical protein GDA53_04230 [Rhodobacteraceae bacterium]|nr:hypothetical protein [Paracoccaceae bacterium]